MKQQSVISDQQSFLEQQDSISQKKQTVTLDGNREDVISNSEITNNLYMGQKLQVINPLGQEPEISTTSKKDFNSKQNLSNDTDNKNTQYIYDNEEDNSAQQNRIQKIQSITSNQYDVQERQNVNQSQINSLYENNETSIQVSQFQKNADSQLGRCKPKKDLQSVGEETK